MDAISPVKEPSPASSPGLRVAVAGTDGGKVDEHFGQAETFLVYDVTAAGAVLADSRGVSVHAQGAEDRRDTIVRMLADCSSLLVARIGPVPQAKLAAAGIDATDAFAEQPVAESLAALWTQKNNPQPDEPLAPADFSTFRMMHAMLRVADMERSLDFYCRLLGMQVLARREHKKNQFTQVYLGYAEGEAGMVLELVQNWSRDEAYTPGDGFGHLAIAVNGIGALCRQLETEGVPLPRPPRSQRHGENIVAFAEDPDGYRVELVQIFPTQQETQA
ncbi:MAG TPA: VOC family protein [Candidatus Sulfotelmatobacter sp.]|jgi:lactoylglutathione lyase|nr:VOC family protein [Candidatus Sulfotelmatobacter sp.]